MRRTRFKALSAVAALIISSLALPPAYAAIQPGLSIDQGGNTTNTSAQVTVGTTTFTIDIHLNSGGDAFSTLTYAVTTSGPASVTYVAFPASTSPLAITAYDSPFVSGDIFEQPSPGATVNSASSGTTVFFKQSAGDYAAVTNSSIATYDLNTASLPVGSYVFTPVLQEITNGSGLDQKSNFASPGLFTLNVVAAPEPASLSVLVLAGTSLLIRRRPRVAV